MNLEQKHVRDLNREIEFQRRGRLILKTVLILILTITVIGPTILLVILNSDWIDKTFNHWQVQFSFLLLTILTTSYLYIKWKFYK